MGLRSFLIHALGGVTGGEKYDHGAERYTTGFNRGEAYANGRGREAIEQLTRERDDALKLSKGGESAVRVLATMTDQVVLVLREPRLSGVLDNSVLEFPGVVPPDASEGFKPLDGARAIGLTLVNVIGRLADGIVERDERIETLEIVLEEVGVDVGSIGRVTVLADQLEETRATLRAAGYEAVEVARGEVARGEGLGG